MARGATITVENQFTRGLITEFSAMNFPENAVTDADNCVFSELGKVTPRLGADFEANYELHLISDISPMPDTGREAFVEFEWFSVGNNGATKFIVQQIGRRIRFFRSDGGSLSNNLETFYIDLATYRVGTNTVVQVREAPCQFTSGNGHLFIVNPFCSPLFVEYSPGPNTITVSEIDIEIRDMQGVDDFLETDEQPPNPSSNRHVYNLMNQGWYWDNGSGSVLDQWRATGGIGDNDPSNANIWWLYKEATGEIDFSRSREITVGNTPAPKGHYIYNAFDVDRNDKVGLTGIPGQSSDNARPSVVVWYAGRVWYAGVKKNRYSSTLYYSQLVEQETQYGRCYQINDPTSETVFDLLDTDGGTIILPLIEEVVSMKVINDSLVIIGTNAIYAIRGADSGPFRATDYIVQYISSVGAVSHLSVVEAEGSLVWFNYEGIYSINPDQTGTTFTVNNVSKQTIQSVVAAIPVANRNYIKGAYNRREQIIRWIYSDQSDLNYFRYNRFLDLNLASKAFYTHTIDITRRPRVCGILSTRGETEQEALEDVYDDNGDEVVDGSGEVVQVEGTELVPNQEVFKFAICGRIVDNQPGFTYGELRNTDYRDWFSAAEAGTSYTAYLISGYRIRGEFLRTFNATPVAVVVRNIEDGSLNMSGVWDYDLRESLPQQLYTTSSGDYIVRRIKLRGKGKSLQLKFTSEEGKPFELIGWSTFDTGGQQP